MFSLNEVGALVHQNNVTFSIYLPSIIQPDFSVNVLYISKSGQFNKNVKADKVSLSPVSPPDTSWGDVNKSLWRSLPINLQPGTYLYRYEIEGPSKTDGTKVRSLYFSDPFARETESGIFSVFHIGQQASFQWNEPIQFKVPWITDAIIYELNVAEFNYTFDGIIERISYLKSLGVNVIELLPVTGVAEPWSWGYTPINYFSPEERFGGPLGLKRMVQECHNADIAVILDIVLPHSDFLFPYQIAYERFFYLWFDNQYNDPQTGTLEMSPNPLVSKHFRFGNKNDFRMKSTIEFFTAVNEFWINEYHIDGFRYDHCNGFLDKAPVPNNEQADWDNYRPTFQSLQKITNSVYNYSKQFDRFKDPDGSRIIQIAEDLNEGSYQLSGISNSTINGCWEEKLYSASTDMAVYNCLNGNYLNELLMKDNRWNNFTETKTFGADKIPVSPIIYNNCHDKSYLLYRIERRKEWEETAFDYPSEIDKMAWFKLQPYAIALLTCVGTPMIWSGEEFAESYGLPSDGYLRVRGARFLHWYNFYTPNTMPDMQATETVLPLTTLYRNLCDLRKSSPALRSPRTNAVKESEDFKRKLIVYRRWLGSQIFVIVVNFSDEDYSQIWVPFGHPGVWVDVLDKYYHPQMPYSVSVESSGWKDINITSNFGRIFMLT